MIELSDEQKAACCVQSLESIEHTSIIACAGSGKTLTATRRFLEIYKFIEHKESIALFSYSNVAVSAFYNELKEILPAKITSNVHISTFDSFLTEFIIVPHGKRWMGCTCTPFLISGAESFLNWKNYKVYGALTNNKSSKKIPFRFDQLEIKPNGSNIEYFSRVNNYHYYVEANEAKRKICSVGKLGGYTHSLRSLWAAYILNKEPRLAEILSKKFPYIIIDEAQDIGFLHANILKNISKNSKITLIGDPNQAIYNFAHADGSFLSDFSQEKSNNIYKITSNWRSIEPITSLSNKLSNTETISKRNATNDFHGIYYVIYEQDNERKIVDQYISLLMSKGYSLEKSAILCRSNNIVNKILCNQTNFGEGITQKFVEAAICRDANEDIKFAFNKLIRAIFALVKDLPNDFVKTILNFSLDSNTLKFRRILWNFLRFSETGLPSSLLSAKNKWLPCLRANLEKFLPEFSEMSGLQLKDSWKKCIRSNNLPDGPLYTFSPRSNMQTPPIRVDTVHKAKGESLDSVLYVVTKPHLEAFFAGTGSEEGRIGYVALTRAKDLFIIAIPASCLEQNAPKLAELNILPLVR